MSLLLAGESNFDCGDNSEIAKIAIYLTIVKLNTYLNSPANENDTDRIPTSIIK